LGKGAKIVLAVPVTGRRPGWTGTAPGGSCAGSRTALDSRAGSSPIGCAIPPGTARRVAWPAGEGRV